MQTTEEPIEIEQLLQHDRARVWQAITDPEQMPKWFFEPIRAFRPQVGFVCRFTVDLEERSFPHVWTVLEVDPGRGYTLDWRYDGYGGVATVRFVLEDANGGTRIRVTHTVTEDTDVLPEFEREAGVQGWTYFLQQSLPAYLEAAPGTGASRTS